ncbi:MAG: ATP synthase F1 subunit delta [Vicinamibacterales bacterium]|nr:ATP synthase F1 subunit delta [Vicinamibacterales bacterium]
MSTRSSATRYARALLEVAAKEADPVKAGADLSAFTALVGGHADLRRALTSPSVPASGKRAIVEAVGAKIEMAAPVVKLLSLLATRDRLHILDELAAAYRERLQDQQQMVRADVHSAAPLDAARTAALQARLASATGRRVVLETRVDPSLIGGLVARIGSTVYDGSVRTQLEKMRARLTE